MRPSFLTRTAVLALAALLAHIVFTAAIATALHWRHPHRIYNVQRWSVGKERSDLIRAFLHSRSSDRVFVGSSFTFGYPWPESATFSALVGGTNVSMLGTDLTGLHDYILCNLEYRASRTLVLEIPVVNSLSVPNSFLECQVSATQSFFAFAITRPLGIGWLLFFWDELAYPRPDEPVVVAAVPDGYFATTFDQAKFADQLVRVLAKAKSVAGAVYVLPSPVYLPGVAQVGRDARAVREQIDFTLATCRRVPGVICLDPSAFYDRPEYFYNITHLSQKGHRAMAEWLAKQIR